MIEMTELPGNRTLCVRLQGLQSAVNFGTLSDA
jgi:hypothetical protein